MGDRKQPRHRTLESSSERDPPFAYALLGAVLTALYLGVFDRNRSRIGPLERDIVVIAVMAIWFGVLVALDPENVRYSPEGNYSVMAR